MQRFWMPGALVAAFFVADAVQAGGFCHGGFYRVRGVAFRRVYVGGIVAPRWGWGYDPITCITTSRYRYCYPTWGYPYVTYYRGYGYAPYATGPTYSPLTSSIDTQNRLLREQNDLLRRQMLRGGQDANGARLNVPLPQADQDRLTRRERTRRDRVQTYVTAGFRLFSAGHVASAAERFETATESASDDATPWFLLAHAKFGLGNYGAAADALKRGLAIDPDWLQLDLDLRDLYEEEADHTEQLGRLARHLQDQPLDRDGLLVLGFELAMTQRADKARPVLQQVARLEADDRHLEPFFDLFAKMDGLPVPQDGVLDEPSGPPADDGFGQDVRPASLLEPAPFPFELPR